MPWNRLAPGTVFETVVSLARNGLCNRCDSFDYIGPFSNTLGPSPLQAEGRFGRIESAAGVTLPLGSKKPQRAGVTTGLPLTSLGHSKQGE
jgi:hypothetical protein